MLRNWFMLPAEHGNYGNQVRQECQPAKLDLIKQKIEKMYVPSGRDGSELVVVTMNADGYEMPVDVVSSRGFFAHLKKTRMALTPLGRSPYDWYSKRPYVHSQRFSREGNEHVIRAVKKWRSVVNG